MILKLSIVGLFIVLIVVLTISYYTQLDGFITTKTAVNVMASKDDLIFMCAANTDIQGGLGNGKIYKSSRTGNGISMISVSQETTASAMVSNCACLKLGTNVAADVMKCIASSGKGAASGAATSAATSAPASTKTASSEPIIDELDACAGITDATAASKVPLACLQQLWVNNRCTLKGGYLPDIQSEFAKIANVKNFDDSLINFGVIKMGLNRLIGKGVVTSGPQCLGPAPAPAPAPAQVAPAPAQVAPVAQVAPAPAPVAQVAQVVPGRGSVASTAAAAALPQRNDIQPEVVMSDTSYDAMILKQKSDLLSNIQKMFRNELLANRSTDASVIDKASSSSYDSSSTQQGKEYNKTSQKCESDDEDSYRCPKNPDGSCPPVPDMTQYIKKDAIPCWGCSVDY
jgi:hypothetical protein